MEPQQWYVEQLDVINRISESLCRRNGVQGADAEDFAADVRLKLLQDDYAVLRKYRGASSPTTFLTVVISNLFRDHRIKQWGRWRPSAKAKGLGELAVMLETAIYRDRQTFEEACQRIQGNGRLTTNREQLLALYKQLPPRAPRRLPDDRDPESVPSSPSSDEPTLEDEREAQLAAARAAVNRAIAHLEPEDQVLIRLHYFEGLSVADVSRATGALQKPLYAKLKRLLQMLSADLGSQGIGKEFREWLDSGPP